MIQRKTVVYDDYGGEIEAWAELATVPAQVVQVSGREFLAADQVQAEQRVLFRTRWIEGITVLDRVSYSDRLHNIQDVKELGRREGVELHTIAAA
ncbi:MAG: phage head closure protein [Sphingomonas sp.]|uniref:phage head closure protein n=1 Tax=Sphingomonas sp. TaxID=28214 RepID=UPI0017E82297|nr:phage head closure protein [Sphingomonas sp.]MBA3667935.1 phage head closure protein [Sphingomonas sp.]